MRTEREKLIQKPVRESRVELSRGERDRDRDRHTQHTLRERERFERMYPTPQAIPIALSQGGLSLRDEHDNRAHTRTADVGDRRAHILLMYNAHTLHVHVIHTLHHTPYMHTVQMTCLRFTRDTSLQTARNQFHPRAHRMLNNWIRPFVRLHTCQSVSLSSWHLIDLMDMFFFFFFVGSYFACMWLTYEQHLTGAGFQLLPLMSSNQNDLS